MGGLYWGADSTSRSRGGRLTATAVALCMTHATINTCSGVGSAASARGTEPGAAALRRDQDRAGRGGGEGRNQELLKERDQRVAHMRAIRRGDVPSPPIVSPPIQTHRTAEARTRAQPVPSTAGSGAAPRVHREGRQKDKGGAPRGICKPRGNGLPFIRKPRTETQEERLRRQIRETIPALCPDYDEEALRQLALEEPHIRTRVMLPVAITTRNATERVRRERTPTGRLLGMGADGARELLRRQRFLDREQG